MNVRRVCMLCFGAVLLLVDVGIGLNKSRAAPPAPSNTDGGFEVLTRGPVHEAFAETVTFDPEPGIVVPKSPPELIEEVPPTQMPEGANVVWIPGYWGWDDERNDFLWISGIWRDLPPGRQWMPGYWVQAEQGFQWVPGYWADAAASETQYLPEPPATIEAGPNIAATSADQIWVPGSWVWNQNRYAWQPGSWTTAQADWSWVPAHYVWSPRGYVFVNGYYDHSIDRRGVLFAPVYFSNGAYAQPGFSYSPATVINPAVFASQLFLRPNYQHYYFGDYYAANYSSAGYHPWFSYNSGRRGYDPIYAQQRWNHRRDQGWEQNVQADFQHRRDHEDARPPRTWAAQRDLMANEGSSRQKSFVIAAPLEQLARSKESPLQFREVDQDGRQRLATRQKEYQKFRQERQQLDAGPRPTVPGTTPQNEPVRAKLSRSPFFANPASEPGKGPPQVPTTPQVDPQFEPKPRVARSPDQLQPRTTNRFPLDGPQSRPGNEPPVRPGINPPAEPQPQPRVDPPGTQPGSRANRPDPQPEPQPPLNPPVTGPQPTLNRPDPNPRSPGPNTQPQPRLNPPVTRPQPTLNRPDPNPRSPGPNTQPQPRLNPPATGPQPKLNRPDPNPRPQGQITPPQSPPRINPPATGPAPKLGRPAASPPPQRPAISAQSQPRINPASQPQTKLNRPNPSPQPQRQITPPQSPLKVDQPGAQRPKVNLTERSRGSAGPPSAGSQPEKRKSDKKD